MEPELALVLVLFLLLGVGGPLVLYVLVRDEAERGTRMRRDDGERAARRDTDEDR
jgi:hypothetical protein